MFNKKVLVVSALICLVSPQAWACLERPIEPTLTHDDIIFDTSNIFLVTVISAELNNKDIAITKDVRRRGINYVFETKEIIKGKNDKIEFSILKSPNYKGKPINDYTFHNDQEFWDQKFSGRVVPGCPVSGYGFVVGIDYLIFTDDIPININTVKAMMPIIYNDNDKWLKYVREKVKEQAGAE